MNLPQLYYFKKLAEIQHYTRAAKELFITQPTLSNSISQLERELKIPLIERESRSVHLTRYGKEFYEYVSEALNALDKGIAIANEHAGSLSGSIEIGTIYTIQGDYLPALLSAYRDVYGTKITTNVSQGLSLPLIEDLENDRYEVAFTAFVPGRPDLTFVPVFTQQLVAIMHESHPLAQKEHLSIDDLQGVRQILTYPPATPVGSEINEILNNHSITPATPFYNDEITLASMVETNAEAIGLSLNTIGLAPFKELVIKSLADIPDDFHQVCLVYKTSAFKTRSLENFITFVKDFEWKGNRIVGTEVE